MSDDGDRVFPGLERNGSNTIVALDPALARIEAYWTEVRAGRLVPARAEIDPRGLQGVLSNAFIVERVSTGLARIRISGSHITEFLGMETRGLPLSTVFDPASRETLSELLEAVFDDPVSARLSLVSDRGFNRPELMGSMVLLPLRSDLGDITRILGGVSMSGKFGATPRKLRITGLSRKSLIGYAAPRGKSTGLTGRFIEEKAPPLRPIEGNADTTPPNRQRLTSDHLRLVVCNDD